MSNSEFPELEDDFGEVMSLLRAGRVEPPQEVPSEDLWASIADAVGMSTEARVDAGIKAVARDTSDLDADDLKIDELDADGLDTGEFVAGQLDVGEVLNGEQNPADSPNGDRPVAGLASGVFGIEPVEEVTEAFEPSIVLEPSAAPEPQPSIEGPRATFTDQAASDAFHRRAREASLRPISSARSFNAQRRRRVGLVAAAAAVIAAVPIGLNLMGSDTDLRADLVALDEFTASGQAELDGRTLVVDVDTPAAPEGSYYELWLLEVSEDGLQDLRSLGAVEPGGEYEIDDSIDLGRFDVVDVSLEPDDGNPDHSGVSVARGELGEA